MKKLKLIISLACMMGSFTIYSQRPDTLWMRTFSNSGTDMASDVYTDHEGNIMIGGSFKMGPKYNYVMIKTNTDGDSLWGKTFAFGDESSTLARLIPTIGNGWAMTGTISGPTLQTSIYSDVALIRLASDYSLELAKRIGYPDRSENATSIIQQKNENFIISGFSIFPGSGYDIQLLLVQYDGALMDKLHYESLHSTICFDICNSGDYGFALTGRAQDPAYFDDAFIYRHNDNADTVFMMRYGDLNEYHETGHRIRSTSDDGFIVAGSSGGYLVPPNYTFVKKNFYVFKTDAIGLTQWEHSISSNYTDMASSAIETIDGGFAACGSYWDYTSKGLLVRYNAEGDTLWTYKWGNNKQAIHAIDLLQLPDSSFIVVGNYREEGKENDIFIARISDAIPDPYTGIALAQQPVFTIRIFPNPALDQVTIETHGNIPVQGITIGVYDLLGQRINSWHFADLQEPDNKVVIDLPSLKSGVYLCTVEQGNGQRDVQKLVIR